MGFLFREYRTEDKGKIQLSLIDKKRLDKYTLKTLKHKLVSFLGLYRPYIYLLEDAENNEIIGMAVLINKIDYSFRRMEWWIEALNVAAEQRRSGFGAMLMHHVCDELRRRGAKKIYFNLESDNVIAKSFHMKLGFIPSRRIFTLCKKPVSPVSPSSGAAPLVPVKSKNEKGIILQNLIPHDHSQGNRWIGLYAKVLTFLHLLVTDVAQGITAKGQVRSIAFIYFYFMVRVAIILPDMLDAAKLEQIVRSEFSKFSLRYWRKIILFVICKGPNRDVWPCSQTLPKVCDIEDLVEFELSQI